MHTNTWILERDATGSLSLHHPHEGNTAVTSPLPDEIDRATVCNPAAVEPGSTVVARCRVTGVGERAVDPERTIHVEVEAVEEVVATSERTTDETPWPGLDLWFDDPPARTEQRDLGRAGGDRNERSGPR